MTDTGPLSLGLDVGTTSTKALVMDSSGRTVAVASAHHGIERTAEGVQADPAVWIVSARAAVADVGRETDLARVATIGLSGNMSALVLVDETLAPVAPALLLADPRGATELRALPVALRSRLREQSGNEPAAVFSLSSLLWWREHHPATLAAARRYLSAKDFLRASLTGETATEATDAANSLLLAPDGDWDDDSIAELGLPRHLFPPLLPSRSCGGRVTEQAARLFGVPIGIPVALGAGDVAAALVGSGGLGDDEVVVSLGTSAVMMAAVDAGADHLAEAGMTRHPDADGTTFALASLLTGGLVLNWLRATVGADALRDAVHVPDAADPVRFLPYLAGTGTPDFDEGATGTLLGITPSTAPSQIVGAALEAVAFDLADLLDRLAAARTAPYDVITASGGGTQLAAWPQIIADVTGIPVRVVDGSDLAAVGAASLGWSAAGRLVEASHAHTLVLPRPEFADAWRIRRHRYRETRRVILEADRLIRQTSPVEKGSS